MADGDKSWVPTDLFVPCSVSECEFDIVEGEYVANVATWHPNDSGFGLAGNPAVISFVDEYAGHPESETQCYRLYIQGAWDDSVSVSVYLEAEYGIFGISPNDEDSDLDPARIPEGIFELREEVDSAPWEPWILDVWTLKYRGEITFSIETRGDGNARFYYIELSGNDNCDDTAVRLDA